MDFRSGLPKGIGEAYQYRRIMDRSFGWSFPFFILIIAFSLIPIVSEYVSSASPEKGRPGLSIWLFRCRQWHRCLALGLLPTVSQLLAKVGNECFLTGRWGSVFSRDHSTWILFCSKHL